MVAATSGGELLLLRLHNVAAERWEPREMQEARLEEALRANVMKAGLGGG